MIKAVPPSLESIRAKVEAGDRLSFDDGMFLDDPAVPLNEVAAREPGARAEERPLRVLQYQHAFEPHERLRLSLHVLCVPLRSARPERVRDE